MCQDCGCSQIEGFSIEGEGESEHSHGHSHNPHDAHVHAHDRPHEHHEHGHHEHEHPGHQHTYNHTHTIAVHEALLSKNDRLAGQNRGYFQAKGLLVLNLLSSPGSGKTALIERTVSDLGDRLVTPHPRSMQIGVIVGDLATNHDAQRLRNAGAPAIQITTGNACHLEAEMVARAMQQLDLDQLDILVIENVGNLVCPAAYDLGEDLRVALLSVTEGEDKPLKYPTLFKSADVVLLTKMDIAEAVGFNRELAIANIQRMAPQATLLEVSSRTGLGMEHWYAYLTKAVRQRRPIATTTQLAESSFNPA